MSAPAAAPAPATGAPKKGNKLVLAVVCLVFTGAGAAFPMVVNLSGKPKDEKAAEAAKDPKEKPKTAIVPFGEVVVNLSEERFQRYLRVKIAVLVEAEAEKEVTDLVAKKKAAIKSAMIAHLAGKGTKDVTGTAGVARMQRELMERFEEVAYPDGTSKAKAVLFEEYVVQ